MTDAVTIHQPNYLYQAKVIAKILQADFHIVLDDVQFVRREWQSRSLMYGSNWNSFWLSIPVRSKPARPLLINAHLVDAKWKAKHLRTLVFMYHKYPFFDLVYRELLVPLYSENATTVTEIGERFLRLCLSFLNANIQVVRSSQLLEPSGLKSSDLLARLCQAARRSNYVTGPGSKNYLVLEPFDRLGINVFFHDFNDCFLTNELGCQFLRHRPIPPSLRRINILDLLCYYGAGQTAKTLKTSCSSIQHYREGSLS